MDFLNNADVESEENTRLREEFSKNTGIGFSGYFFSTKQASPQLKISKSLSGNKLVELISFIQDLNLHLIPIDSYIQYEIYDSNIDSKEYHHYILYIGSDIKIINEYNNEVVSTFETIYDAIIWIQENANYEEV